jgi:hypothetical protein
MTSGDGHRLHSARVVRAGMNERSICATRVEFGNGTPNPFASRTHFHATLGDACASLHLAQANGAMRFANDRLDSATFGR